MNKEIQRIGKRIGIDKSIAYTSSTGILQGFSGIISIFFISTFLTGVEQGFYYTFGSILALQVFFELGLTGIITQFVAHEVAHLKWDETMLIGQEKYRSRLSSLLHFSVKWYSIISIIVLITLIIVGFTFFSKYGGDESSNTDWILPWLLICIGTAIKLLMSPILSIFLGLGKVKEVSKIRFYQQILIPICTWLGLALGFKLYVVGIGYILSVIYTIVYIFATPFKNIFINLWRIKITDRVNYIKEIFPYQWKIAISWISGYFIFQLFNPVLFATEGAVVAGQMGMTLQVLNAIQGLSLNWINTKVPLFSNLIALKDYTQLDRIFNTTVKQMIRVCAFCLICFFIGIFFINELGINLSGRPLGNRFLSYLPMLLMMTPLFLNQYISSWATYLRCHKKEPFLLISIISGILCLLSTTILGKYFGLYGITCGYCFITIVMFPYGYWIFKTKKEEWHVK